MKRKNFPGRKNQRRQKVLKRLIDNPPKYTTFNSYEKEIEVLKHRIISSNEARSIRTKKRRDGK